MQFFKGWKAINVASDGNCGYAAYLACKGEEQTVENIKNLRIELSEIIENKCDDYKLVNFFPNFDVCYITMIFKLTLIRIESKTLLHTRALLLIILGQMLIHILLHLNYSQLLFMCLLYKVSKENIRVLILFRNWERI